MESPVNELFALGAEPHSDCMIEDGVEITALGAQGPTPASYTSVTGPTLLLEAADIEMKKEATATAKPDDVDMGLPSMSVPPAMDSHVGGDSAGSPTPRPPTAALLSCALCDRVFTSDAAFASHRNTRDHIRFVDRERKALGGLSGVDDARISLPAVRKPSRALLELLSDLNGSFFSRFEKFDTVDGKASIAETTQLLMATDLPVVDRPPERRLPEVRGLTESAAGDRISCSACAREFKSTDLLVSHLNTRDHLRAVAKAATRIAKLALDQPSATGPRPRARASTEQSPDGELPAQPAEQHATEAIILKRSKSAASALALSYFESVRVVRGVIEFMLSESSRTLHRSHYVLSAPRLLCWTGDAATVDGSTLRLKPHQLEGLNWLLVQRASGSGGAILADEMGLGKTVQVIALFAQLAQWYIEEGEGGEFDHATEVLSATERPAATPAERLFGGGEGGASDLTPDVVMGGGIGGDAKAVAVAAGTTEARNTSPDISDTLVSARCSSSRGERLKLVLLALSQQPGVPAPSLGVTSLQQHFNMGSASASERSTSTEPVVCGFSVRPTRVATIDLGLSPPGRGSVGPHLIVAPASVMDNWAREIARWCPALTVVRMTGSAAERRGRRRELVTANIVLTSYSMLERGETLVYLTTTRFDVVVFDEAHELKNADTALYGNCTGIQASHRVLLTGTPVQNTLGELAALLRLVSADTFRAADAGADGARWLKEDDIGDDDEEDGARLKRQEEVNALVSILKKSVDAYAGGAAVPVGRAGAAPPSASVTAAGTSGSLAGFASATTKSHPHGSASRQRSRRQSAADPLEDVLGALVLRRTKDSVVGLDLPLKTRRVEWVSQTTLQAEISDALHALTLLLAKPGSLLAAAVRDAVAHGLPVAVPLGMFGVPKNASAPKTLFETDKSPTEIASDVEMGNAGAPTSLAKDAAGCGESDTAAALLGTGALGKLLALMRKAAIHPLLLRTRFSNLDCLAIARAVHDGASPIAGQGGGGRHCAPMATLVTSMHSPVSQAELVAWANGDAGLIRRAKHILALSDFEISHMCEFEAADAPNASAVARAWTRLVLPVDALMNCGKMIHLRGTLSAASAKGARVVVFSQFTGLLDILAAAMDAYPGGLGGATPLRWARVDGSTPVAQRQTEIDRFTNDVGIAVMLLSTRAGGVGINLVAASEAVIFDCDWNPAMDLQAEDRIHRMGQLRDVTVWRLFTKGSIELYMGEVAEGKRGLAEALLEMGQD